jgi:hypothetical protein
MINLLLAEGCLSFVFLGLIVFLVKRVDWNYRGVLLIIASGLYFSLFFILADLMQESFR